MIKACFIKNIKNISFLFCLVFAGNSAFSQKIVEVKYQQDSRGAYLFSCYNHAYCNYILKIQFTKFNNVKTDQTLPYRAEVKPGTNKLFFLFPVNPNDPVQFNYTSSYNKGCIHPETDTAFTYLLPISPGKEAQAYELQNPGKSDAGDIQQNKWYVIRLKMKPGDTIYAARRGVVTEVADNDSTNDAGLASAGRENYIEIVHADCSFGHYGILRKNSSLVKPGQTVKAGEPIGLVGGDKYGRGSETRFSVYFNQEEDVSQNGGSIWKMYMVYVPLQFWTKNNGKGRLRNGALYISEYPPSVLNQELPHPVIHKKKPKKKR